MIPIGGTSLRADEMSTSAKRPVTRATMFAVVPPQITLRPGAARNASTTLRSSARSIGGPVKREIERIWRISEPMTVASSPGSPP